MGFSRDPCWASRAALRARRRANERAWLRARSFAPHPSPWPSTLRPFSGGDQGTKEKRPVSRALALTRMGLRRGAPQEHHPRARASSSVLTAVAARGGRRRIGLGRRRDLARRRRLVAE